MCGLCTQIQFPPLPNHCSSAAGQWDSLTSCRKLEGIMDYFDQQVCIFPYDDYHLS